MTDSTAALTINLLGRPQAWHGDTELDLGAARRRAVFTVLAMRAGCPVRREDLVSAVWGTSVPASANTSLYAYISGLRQVLEPQRDRWAGSRLLVTASGGYCLRVPKDSLDVHRFHSLREEARRRRSEGDATGELLTLEKALALWRGEALAGVPGPFAEAQRAHLDELRLATLERRAAVKIDLGGHEDLVGELTGLAHQHPLREELHRLLMVALCRGGRQAEALDVFRRARAVLVEQAGSEPGHVLRELHERILASAGDPGRCCPPKTPPARREPMVSPAPPRARAFIGREAELDLLRDAVAGLKAGRGGCVWFDGEPGVGKSALLAEALSGVTAAGCGLFWGTGDELTRTVPMNALRCLGGDPVATTMELCSRAPVVLVLDDMQWVDEESVLAWRHLHRLTQRLPLLLVVAARPTRDRRDIELLREQVGTRTLNPLDEAETRELVTVLAPDSALAEPVARLAGGNPFYIRAAVSEALESGWNPDDAPPVRLMTAVREHLRFLLPHTSRVLSSAAFLGDDCTVAEISAASGTPVPSLLESIEDALATGVLAEQEDRLTFPHPIVRRVLYCGMPSALRVVVHQQLAQALAATAAPPERVAAQLAAGPVPVDDWARDWLAEHGCELDPRLVASLLGEEVLDGDAPGGCPGSAACPAGRGRGPARPAAAARRVRGARRQLGTHRLLLRADRRRLGRDGPGERARQPAHLHLRTSTRTGPGRPAGVQRLRLRAPTRRRVRRGLVRSRAGPGTDADLRRAVA
ncbi:DNA-binding transcriptional activator of the SARP family [Allokutzneria albata]|uniref:DNA-binding transcriptional activator of the SARP family n=1 Tax=Allokutzneria albata TaxID=211114 RepID=A0A1G9WBA6_ALLAB|nr:BTAD domain-containing putative transcriptional regulator [Allokutzneria albata]SDM81597.1 DNA-binding transcriptional activator of the SARP family [Allokutzneria albata]